MAEPERPVRDSVYPEAFRYGDWDEATTGAGTSRWWVWYVAATVVAAAFAAWLGAVIGHAAGTSPSYVASPAGTEVNVVQLDVGACITALPSGERAKRVTVVPCTTAHRAEVVATMTYLEASWPGDESARSQLLNYCGAEIQPGEDADAIFKPADWADGLRWVAWVPTAAAWNDDNRTGLCIATVDADVYGSFVAGTADWER